MVHPAPDVVVAPIAAVSDERIEEVRSAIETHFRVRTSLERPIPLETEVDGASIHEQTYDSDRGQYDAAELATFGFPGVDATVLVTDRDVFVGRKEYVFGVARQGGSTAVVSTFRLAETGASADDATARVRKQAIKQFGWLCGAERCTTEGCVMGTTALVGELDEQDEYICPDCTAAIGAERLR